MKRIVKSILVGSLMFGIGMAAFSLGNFGRDMGNMNFVAIVGMVAVGLPAIFLNTFLVNVCGFSNTIPVAVAYSPSLIIWIAISYAFLSIRARKARPL